MKIYIGSDHAGFELKERIVQWLLDNNHQVKDFGAYAYAAQDDYPDFVVPATKAVVANPGSRGIILGGSGQGEAIAANRVRGSRACVYYGHDIKIVKLAREHNDANILSLGARFVDYDAAIEAIKHFLIIDFSDQEKYARRIKKAQDLLS